MYRIILVPIVILFLVLVLCLVQFLLYMLVLQELADKFGEEREEERAEAVRTRLELDNAQRELEELRVDKARVASAMTDTEEELRRSAREVTVPVVFGCWLVVTMATALMLLLPLKMLGYPTIL